MKVLSLFSGIGAFEKALSNLDIPYELVGYCEIDKYASKSYSAIHGVPESLNLGDITKIDEKKLPKDIDLITYGFPCQDISLAGKQKGLFNEDGTQTRSGLFFDALRIIEETKPCVAIAENVKNLTSKKFALQFKIVLDSLKAAGYNNYFQVLNAKDYGIPQNRERVFIVSIRKDIDTGSFTFPDGFELETRLKDIMEEVVDEKFFMSDKAMRGLIQHRQRNEEKGNGFGFNLRGGDDVEPTIRARYYKDGQECLVADPAVRQIGNCCPTKNRDNPNQGRIYDAEGISPTLNCMGGGNRQPFVIVKEATKKGYAEAVEGDSINLEHPNSQTRRGRVGHQVAQTLTTSCNQAVVEKVGNIYPSGGENGNVYLDSGLSPTLKAGTGVKGNGIGSCNSPKILCGGLRIRKLTPKECFRLMGFDDFDFEKAETVNSNTQLYKQAGNSIVVPVVQRIIQNLTESGVLSNVNVYTEGVC